MKNFLEENALRKKYNKKTELCFYWYQNVYRSIRIISCVFRFAHPCFRYWYAPLLRPSWYCLRNCRANFSVTPISSFWISSWEWNSGSFDRLAARLWTTFSSGSLSITNGLHPTIRFRRLSSKRFRIFDLSGGWSLKKVGSQYSRVLFPTKGNDKNQYWKIWRKNNLHIWKTSRYRRSSLLWICS